VKAIFSKRHQGIFPTGEDGLKLITSMNNGELCKVEFIRKRNYLNHRRFFKFIEVAFDNQDFYDNPEHLRKALQMAAGHYETLIIQNAEGEISTQYIPKSIEFEKLDEEAFQKIFKECITQFINRYGNGLTEEQLLKVIDFD